MVTIQFYKYTGYPNTVNKTLGDSTDIDGVLRDNFDIESPVVTIRQDEVPTFNYCYVPVLKRYYFINDVSIESSDKYTLRLSIDVLKTYETEILQATATIRNRENADPYISNRENIYNNRPNFEQLTFPNTGLLTEEGSIIMVTIKGNT